MQQTATSSPENKRYNDETLLLDGLYEFHPEYFRDLDDGELQVLQAYYLTGQPVPENIFDHRLRVTRERPELERAARAAFSKICRHAGIT